MSVVHEGRSGVATLTVVHVDAMPVIRDGLRAIFADEADITIAAEGATRQDAVLLATRHRPDVLVVDLAPPELVAVSREVQPLGTAVLAFTDEQDDVSVVAAIRAGIRGYLPKSADPDDLVRAIRGMAGGQAIFGAHVAGKVTELLFAQPTTPFAGLTPREREILSLLAAGLSNAAISYQLTVTAKTVRNHMSGIFAKLGVTSRAEAIVRARKAGLGQNS